MTIPYFNDDNEQGGIEIYHKAKNNDEWKLIARIENFDKLFYISKTNIGSVGSLIYTSTDALKAETVGGEFADHIFFFCKVDEKLGHQLTFEQQKSILDRLMKVNSNLMFGKLVQTDELFEETMDIVSNQDLFAIRQGLTGTSYC